MILGLSFGQWIGVAVGIGCILYGWWDTLFPEEEVPVLKSVLNPPGGTAIQHNIYTTVHYNRDTEEDV